MMKTKTALVIGASGLVGSHLVQELRDRGWSVTGTYNSNARPGLVHLDVTDSAQVVDLVRHVGPAVVIQPGGEAGVDKCEAAPELTRAINVRGTIQASRAAALVGASFVFFSTDYVFDGKAGPYSEDALCRPLNEYGRQKTYTEEALRGYPDHLIVRTSGVYGWESQRKNYVIRLIDLLAAGERMPAWTDQTLSPTSVVNLAQVVTDLVEKGVTGTVHVAGSEPMDRLSFARLICEVFGRNPQLLDARTGTSPHPPGTVRPSLAGLRVDKAQSLVERKILSPREGLELMRSNEPKSA
jgi:dTDP-4-dehydrorhamnose reductase